MKPASWERPSSQSESGRESDQDIRTSHADRVTRFQERVKGRERPREPNEPRDMSVQIWEACHADRVTIQQVRAIAVEQIKIDQRARCPGIIKQAQARQKGRVTVWASVP